MLASLAEVHLTLYCMNYEKVILKIIFSAFIIDSMNKHIYKKFQSDNDCINKDTAFCRMWQTMKMAERFCCHGRKTELHGGGFLARCVEWNETVVCCVQAQMNVALPASYRWLLCARLSLTSLSLLIKFWPVPTWSHWTSLGGIAAAGPRAFLAWTWNLISWLEDLPGRLLGRHLLCEVRHSAVSVLNWASGSTCFFPSCSCILLYNSHAATTAKSSICVRIQACHFFDLICMW